MAEDRKNNLDVDEDWLFRTTAADEVLLSRIMAAKGNEGKSGLLSANRTRLSEMIKYIASVGIRRDLVGVWPIISSEEE